MWFKYLFTVAFFWFLALAQSSFLAHYNIKGSVPNLIFIFFIILIFLSYFKSSDFNWQDFFYSITAGIFLDVYYFSYFGMSVVFLLIIGFSTKKLMNLLREKRERYSTVYFFMVFLISFTAYKIFASLGYYFLNSFRGAGASWLFLVELSYNATFALFGFWAYKTAAGFFQPPKKQTKFYK